MKTIIKNIKNKYYDSSIYEIISHTKNYFGAGLATKALGFISIPVLTRLLSPSDYGIVNIFNSYIGIFVVVMTFNMYTAVGRYYYEEKDDFKEFFSTSVILVLFSILIFSVFFVLFRVKISNILSLPLNVIIYMIPIVIFNVATSFFEQIYQPQKKSKLIAIRQVFYSYGNFLIAVIIILLLKNNKYLGSILAQFYLGIIFFIFYFFNLKSYFKKSFSFIAVKYIFSYSVPMIPYALSGVILAQFDRIMINNYSGASDAGLYSFSSNIGILLNIFATAIFSAWIPDYFKYMNSKNYIKLNNDADRILRIILIFALGIIFFGKELAMLLADKSYYTAIGIIPIIVIGYIFNALFSFYGWGIGYSNKTIYSSLVVLSAGILNIILNIIFIPKYGYYAGAVTTAVAYFFMVFLAWFFSSKILQVYCVPVKIIIYPLMIIAPFIFFYFIIESIKLGFFLNVGIKFLIFILFLFLIYKIRNKVIQ